MDKIIKIAKKNNLKIIEDSATALGAKFKEQRTGSIGDFGCFLFINKTYHLNGRRNDCYK